ncbi:glycine cleavage system aminomethyltransferase GcvT [bacterium]|nr:glycine cleavage system aminomethyltransferase GcvT [bacterium]
MEAKKTILYDEHIALNGKMADFAGWLMPLWYETGQSAEHHATRNGCGLFDICHMGEFMITGEASGAFVSELLTNGVEKLDDGRAMYNFMLNEAGGVVDDCILYRFSETEYMLVVNAGDIPGDLAWLRKHAPKGVAVEDISDRTAKIDLQGPNAPKLMVRLAGEDAVAGLKFFRFNRGVDVGGMEVLVSRTGYTGEIGFELYTDADNASRLWNLLLREGSDLGILPCGLGARDTLRTEAGLPLHGHELRPDRVALGHPWTFAMDMEKQFIGRKALARQEAAGIDYYVYPFIMDGKRKAMPGYDVMCEGKNVGTVLSGVISPSLENRPIGFISSARELAPDTVVRFGRPGKEADMDGRITEIPFVPGTSRKKMSGFLA